MLKKGPEKFFQFDYLRFAEHNVRQKFFEPSFYIEAPVYASD